MMGRRNRRRDAVVADLISYDTITDPLHLIEALENNVVRIIGLYRKDSNEIREIRKQISLFTCRLLELSSTNTINRGMAVQVIESIRSDIEGD